MVGQVSAWIEKHNGYNSFLMGKATCPYGGDQKLRMLDIQQEQISNLGSENKMSIAWWAVISRFLLHGLIVSTWVSRIPAVQNALGLSNARLGLCLLGTAIGSVCAIPVTGWCITKFGSKRITAWSTVGFSLALAGLSFADRSFFSVLGAGAVRGHGWSQRCFDQRARCGG